MTRPALTTWIAIAIAAATMLISPTALAEHPSIQSSTAQNDTHKDKPVQAAISQADKKFLKDFARINGAGVDKGKLAEWKAEDAIVKSFATQLIAARTNTIAKIETVATQINIDVKATPNFTQKAKTAILNLSVGHSFDRAYVQAMIDDAEKIVAMLESEMTDGQDASIRQLAWDSLPDVQNQLKVAQDLRVEVADTKFASEIRTRKVSPDGSGGSETMAASR